MADPISVSWPIGIQNRKAQLLRQLTEDHGARSISGAPFFYGNFDVGKIPLALEFKTTAAHDALEGVLRRMLNVYVGSRWAGPEIKVVHVLKNEPRYIRGPRSADVSEVRAVHVI